MLTYIGRQEPGPAQGKIAYLGLGASLGDRLQNLRDAVRRLQERRITLLAASPVYESPHMGREPADGERYPPHLNAVIAVAIDMPPERLLEIAIEVEALGGRERVERWAPRTIDIDLLECDGQSIDSALLTLPHPRLTERAFVARPLLEVAPEFVLPDGRRLQEIVNNDPVRSQVIVRTDYRLV